MKQSGVSRVSRTIARMASLRRSRRGRRVSDSEVRVVTAINGSCHEVRLTTFAQGYGGPPSLHAKAEAGHYAGDGLALLADMAMASTSAGIVATTGTTVTSRPSCVAASAVTGPIAATTVFLSRSMVCSAP